jgi:hypothetical protein
MAAKKSAPVKTKPQGVVEVEETPVVKRKPHYYDIVQNSVSRDENGDHWLNQEVIFREFAFTPEELVLKNMPMMNAVIPVILEGSEAAANAGGFVTDPSKLK